MSNQGKFKGIADVAVKTVRSQGVLGLYVPAAVVRARIPVGFALTCGIAQVPWLWRVPGRHSAVLGPQFCGV